MLNSQENSEIRFPQQLGLCPRMHYNRGFGAIITGHWATPATVQKSVQPERTELDHGRGGQRGARSSGRHRGITLETRNAGVRSILKALIQLPELRSGAAASRKGVLLLIREVSCGKSWGKRDFFFSPLPSWSKGSSARQRRAPARSREPSVAVPPGAANAQGKTSLWIKRPCKPVLATPGSSLSDKGGWIVGLPPLSPLVL